LQAIQKEFFLIFKNIFTLSIVAIAIVISTIENISIHAAKHPVEPIHRIPIEQMIPAPKPIPDRVYPVPKHTPRL
jgi:hypothetical protein